MDRARYLKKALACDDEKTSGLILYPVAYRRGVAHLAD